MSAADLPPGSVVATDRRAYVAMWSTQITKYRWDVTGVGKVAPDQEIDDELANGGTVLRVGVHDPTGDVADLEVELAQTRAELAHADEVANDAGGVDAHAEHAAVRRVLTELVREISAEHREQR